MDAKQITEVKKAIEEFRSKKLVSDAEWVYVAAWLGTTASDLVAEIDRQSALLAALADSHASMTDLAVSGMRATANPGFDPEADGNVVKARELVKKVRGQ